MNAVAVLLAIAPPGDASNFAKSLALVGDQDGDRCAEIAVGSPSDGDGRRGKVFVFSGKTGALLHEISGSAPQIGFGSDVVSVGDQDGDKVPDLAVAAPFVRGDSSEGRVDLISGKDGKVLASLLAEKGERYFGSSLCSLGDVDGDKREDLLVRMHAGAGPEEHERFAAISLAASERLYLLDAPAGVTSHEFGRPLASLPDVDGDRVPDLAIEHGCDVHVHSGSNGKKLATIAAPISPQEKSTFGFSIAGIPAKPGEFPHIAIGDTALDEGLGCVRILRIPVAGEESKEGGGAILPGEENFAGVGCSLAPAGDFNQDGIPDLAVGWSDGRRGGVLLLSAKDLAAAREVVDESDKVALPLGWRVAAGADVTGDGVPDVAVARYWPTAGEAIARSVAIVSGKDGKKVREIVSPAPAAPPDDKAGKKAR